MRRLHVFLRLERTPDLLPAGQENLWARQTPVAISAGPPVVTLQVVLII
jgi:hypothetical protein